jgi:hypothetical protein
VLKYAIKPCTLVSINLWHTFLVYLDRYGVEVMMDDNSLEFDMFEDVRRRLVEILVSEGRERLDAEKIALYVVQGTRAMPKLIKLLAESRSHARSEIISVLKLVLENASALEKARLMLLELDAANAG